MFQNCIELVDQINTLSREYSESLSTLRSDVANHEKLLFNTLNLENYWYKLSHNSSNIISSTLSSNNFSYHQKKYYKLLISCIRSNPRLLSHSLANFVAKTTKIDLSILSKKKVKKKMLSTIHFYKYLRKSDHLISLAVSIIKDVYHINFLDHINKQPLHYECLIMFESLLKIFQMKYPSIYVLENEKLPFYLLQEYAKNTGYLYVNQVLKDSYLYSY